MRSALPLGVLLLALPLAGDTGSVTRSVSVSVTNVDVVVTDSSGRPITDLTPADFEVRQDGKVQPITNFSFIVNPLPTPPAVEHGQLPAPAIVPRDAVPPPAVRAHLIVFLDELHLTAMNRNRALKSLRDYLPTVIGPSVEVQFVTWDRSLRIRGPFISDATVAVRMLDELQKEGTRGDIAVQERIDLIRQIDEAMTTSDPRVQPTLMDSAIVATKAWADAQDADISMTGEAAHIALSSITGVDGRKVLFFLTERLTPRPARDLFDYFQNGMQNAGAGARKSPGSAMAGGPVNELTWTQWDRMPVFRDLTAAANAAGVSIVTIDGAGLGFDDSLSPESNAGYSGRIDSSIGSQDMESAMDLIADQTGGVSIRGTNDLAGGLKRIEADWTAYYSLGYESPDTKVGSERSLRVAVLRKGAHVRTRRTVIERTPEQKVADSVLAGAHIQHTSNPLGATLHIGVAKKSGSMYLLPLEFKVPFEKITLVPQGGRARGAILFTAVVASPEGKASKVTTQRAPLDIPESELASLAGKSFTYKATLKVRPGEQTVSTALTDEVSRLTSFVQPRVLVGDKPVAR